MIYELNLIMIYIFEILRVVSIYIHVFENLQ